MKKKILLLAGAVLGWGLLLSATAPDPEQKNSPALSLSSGPEYWARAFNDSYRVLRLNLKPAEPPFSTRYAVPGPEFKKEVYLWDTAFIALVWKWRDAALGQELFMPLFEIAKPSGMIPHSSRQTRDTQPPVLSWAVWKLHQHTRDLAYLEKVYPYLKNYNRWLYENRAMANGLFFWDNKFESGLDNSPRFTNRAATRVRDLSQIAAVDLCSYMVADDFALAAMADALGKKDEAESFRKKAEELKALVNRHLWDEADGLYYDFDFRKNSLVRINTNASFLPLFAGIPDQARAQRLKNHIMDPDEYDTLIPIPAIALNDPNFLLDMWMGPVWINLDYLIILGMNDYGFNAEAASQSFKIADGLYKVWDRTGKFYEFYDPQSLSLGNLTRKYGFFKRGDKPVEDFVGWTGLVDNLVIEILFGLSKEDGQWTLAPCLPQEAAGMTLSLSLPAEGLEVKLEVESPERIHATVIQGQTRTAFELGKDKSANWPAPR